jgi:hypothetical protein
MLFAVGDNGDEEEFAVEREQEGGAKDAIPLSDVDVTATRADRQIPEQSQQQQQQQQNQPFNNDMLMAAMGTNPRRIFVSFASATGIALAGNFLGMTSNLLTLAPESTIEATGLDTYFPRGEANIVVVSSTATPPLLHPLAHSYHGLTSS